jgi:hypothetical protein
MHCPKCEGGHLCGCKSCAEKNKGKVTYKWPDGKHIACGHCGHTMSADEWLDEEVKQLQETGYWPTDKEEQWNRKP